ncbi:hypothetical protein SELMODRAFT_427433 [Selaginella moellendorffii]|uniref:Bulb-type lectin domain-containing protein n=1 Tax=Selaginella moellendorffii TaxID=88036 RepID=D8SZL5_SELML|nr:hypothetical protein SELMODRAFT_427433 [Selaginella moellendorffii]
MPESSSTRNFNLAIWYDIDPKKTVVWMAMANGQLVQVSENAKLELKAEGGLSVTDGSSSAPLWQTNPGQCCAESASLLENGNLVVLGKDKKVAWQSFDSPTNNLLPEQQLRTQGNPSLGYASGQVLLKNLKLEIPQKYWSIANPTLKSTMTCLDDETGEHVSNNNACQPDRSLKFPGVLNLSSQGGCDYDIPLGACQNSLISVKLVQVNRADYYFNDYNFDSTIKLLVKCKDTCMQDCKCLATAYKYDGTGLCFLKGNSNKLYNGTPQSLLSSPPISCGRFLPHSCHDCSSSGKQPELDNGHGQNDGVEVPREVNCPCVYLWHDLVRGVCIHEEGIVLVVGCRCVQAQLLQRVRLGRICEHV